MSSRFFFSPAPTQKPLIGQQVTLDSHESHHLIHVMRSSVGDSLNLFDGSGAEYEAEIIELNRREVTVRLLNQQWIDRELEEELVIAVPLPKADRQKFMVEKLTEIGATSLLFLNTTRTMAKGNEKTLAKLNRLVIEASKQCGRNRLMQLPGFVDLQQLISTPERFCDAELDRLFAHPSDQPRQSHDADDQTVTEATTGKLIVIGPEGGLTEEEVQLLIHNDWHPMSLGPAILRMETAALVAAVILSTK